MSADYDVLVVFLNFSCCWLVGESEAKLRQLFQEATQLAPCIVFIGRLCICNCLDGSMAFTCRKVHHQQEDDVGCIF